MTSAMIRVGIVLGVLIGVVVVAVSAAAETSTRPNFLLIVADDLGYSDLGSYGSEIETPEIDRIAEEGIRFSNFFVNTMCIVTRTSLLTGHTHPQSRSYRHSVVIAEVLRDAGYATSISGKWHQPRHPMDVGFDRFFGFLGGMINSFTGSGKLLSGFEPVEKVAADFYASDAFTEHAIASVDAAVSNGQPFFSVLSFNAPHTPIQAPRADVEKYVGRYRKGWEHMRRLRYHRLRATGMIDHTYVMTSPEAEVRRWDELAEQTRVAEDFRMAAYAGMVSRLDYNVGRMMAHLRTKGLLDSTVVVFLSDNGADYGGGSIDTWNRQIPWRAQSYMEMSNGWAYLKNTPFRLYKHSTSQGGVAAPLIVRWPRGIQHPAGAILHQRVHVTDLYPTFLELAGLEAPRSRPDKALEPLFGSSMLPLFRDAKLDPYAIHDTVFWEHRPGRSKAMLRGDWKLVSHSAGPWQLYNLAEDPAEATDLAGRHPERIESMLKDALKFASLHTGDDAYWRLPTLPKQQGWGMYRLNDLLGIADCTPSISAIDVPRDTDLSFTFEEDLDFRGTQGKTLRLYAVGMPDTPIWASDPEPDNPAQGKRTITFRDLPLLMKDRSYYVVADSGWVRVAEKPVTGFNDGSFWYRFRTAP